MKKVYNQREFEKELIGGETEFKIVGFTAILRGKEFAILSESSHAELWGSSHAILRGSSYAILRGSSHAELWGSSHAILRESSHAVLRESSHAELWGSSHAELWGSSHAILRESSHAELKDFSCVHLIRDTATVNKTSPQSHIIKIKYPSQINAWCRIKGIVIKDNRIILWKTVDKNGMDFRTKTINYNTSKEILAPDWDKKYDKECGAGLHLADSPSSARIFAEKEFRLFSVSVKTKDCICFGGSPEYPMKIRARACKMIKEYPADYIGG
jgi:hypothetical protein